MGMARGASGVRSLLAVSRSLFSYSRVVHSRLLAADSSCSNAAAAGAFSSSPVARVRCPSLEDFKRDWHEAQRPVVIEAAMENWSSRNWTLDTLVKDFGQAVVHVELSRWNDGEKRWADFRDLYKSKSSLPKEELFIPQHPMLLEDFIEMFCRNSQDQPIRGYLAQQQLLDDLPSMAEGILNPEYVKLGKGLYQRNVWLGPAGTITPLHRDPYYNVLAQVWGKKYIRLYSAKESSNLYPFDYNLYLRNTSQVDVDAPDVYERWPNLANAPYFECSLEAGEMIYIPTKWWHYVRAEESSFSVSFWSV